MSSITTTQAAYLSVPDVAPSYVLDQRPTDQLFEVLPFKPIAGHELSLSTVDASSQGLSALADAEAAGASIVSTMPTITERTFALKRISAEMPVDSMIPGLYGGHRDIVQALLQLKVNAVRDHFKLLLIQGDTSSATEEFNGLKKLASSYSQEFGANGTATDGGTVQAGEIEELLNMLNPRPRTNNVYLVMHAKAYKHLVKNNYADVEFVQHALLGTVPVIAGAPVLVDNFISIAETQGASNDCTSIYAVVLGDEVGLVGIYPASAVGQPIQVRGPVVKESTDTMWFHVSWDVGLACYGKGAVARLYGVKQAN
jgi:hypothetical protein